MEDAHVIHVADDWGFFGVLDGHGGAECSAWCAQRLHEKLDAEGCPADDGAAKKMVLAVDQEFLDTQQSSGSTAAMCIVRPPAKAGGKWLLHVINAGDSRVLLSRADGTIVDGGGTDAGLSTDHKPDYPSEKERIYRCGGTVEETAGGCARVNGDLAVSRGFGDADYKQTGGPGPEDRPVTANPEMGHFECDGTDFLLIVCDGVSEGNFPNAEVCELAAQVLKETKGDAGKACEAVCQRAVEANSKDNISCMIVMMGGPGSPTESAFNGAGTMSLGMRKEFIPGSVIACSDSGFVKAYVAMCDRADVSFAEAVQMRHKMLLARQGTAQAEREDEEELAMIGEPDGEENSVERKAFYEAWAKEHQDGRGGGGGGGGGLGDNPMAALMGGGGGGGPGSQMEMMQMLMGMMQGGVGMRGMGGPMQSDNGRRVRVADLDQLQSAVTAHPALEWDDRMEKLASQEGIVKTDDPSDGTTHVTFPPPVGVVAWLPTDALTDLDDGGGGGGSKIELIDE
eukprot:Tamp_13535.p1 GENE.Tamp_13535~~Tamp_13535.p1  ORF type:complete len:545 (+),score=140.30 Tamp_13535:103-1635(+)